MKVIHKKWPKEKESLPYLWRKYLLTSIGPWLMMSRRWPTDKRALEVLEIGTAKLNIQNKNFTMGMPLSSSSTYSIWISRHIWLYCWILPPNLYQTWWSWGSMLAPHEEGPGFEPGRQQKKTFLQFSHKNGGKFKLSMSNLKQGASPWENSKWRLFKIPVPVSRGKTQLCPSETLASKDVFQKHNQIKKPWIILFK